MNEDVSPIKMVIFQLGMLVYWIETKKQLLPTFLLKTQVTVKVVDFGCAGPLSSERGVEAPWRS